ncbi:MAG: DUF3037 domain-containing protein [Nocardioidaceae bacterium]
MTQPNNPADISRGNRAQLARVGYQYVVLRCVPRVDRQEFLNVGVIVYCHAHDFLRSAGRVDDDRLTALDPGLDLEAVATALEAIRCVCAGEDAAGPAGQVSSSSRFGFLSAARSTVLQPGPIHGGMTRDPTRELVALMDGLVG